MSAIDIAINRAAIRAGSTSELYLLDRVRIAIFQFDRTAGLCQHAHMLPVIKKLVAVFLAVWLPLFGGNALAASVAMQVMNGDCCPSVAQQDGHLHTQHAALHDQSIGDQTAGGCNQQGSHQDPQNSPCGNCGVCHFACSGYMAAIAVKVAESRPLPQLFAAFSAQFQSLASTPLDPPPLARA